MKTPKPAFFKAADLLLAPLTWPAAVLLKTVRRIGVHRLPLCREVFLQTGVFPVRDHYYEPAFNYSGVDLRSERPLPGLDLNMSGQLELLKRLNYGEEACTAFYGSDYFSAANASYGPGDTEFWYQMVRATKPRRIFEIGSGNSTLVAQVALKKNREEDPTYTCRHLCVEPYEMPWLENAGVELIREKVETLGTEIFEQLEDGDIFFVDSSHIIRPGGDVLFIYQQILPRLKKGVIVHIHDIFTPCHYPEEWLIQRGRFWNEQFLLEALLTENKGWRVLAALSHLQRHHHHELKKVTPLLTPEHQPGSFYMVRGEANV